MAEQSPIYLDNHATTRVDPRVVEAMLPYFDREYGNAASTSHVLGWAARDAVELARESIATAVGAATNEIVFTSGATESNNLALLGLAGRRPSAGGHIVSVETEHKAVLDPLERLARRGFEVTLLPVTQAPEARAGWLDPQRVADALRADTMLVSVMLANNEIGVIQSISEIGNICRGRQVALHCDATQAVGKLPVDVQELGVDLMSFTAHKFYGPKGVGGLYVRSRPKPMRLECQILGGGHERGFRSGTLNVSGIVGFAKAVELCLAEMPSETHRLATLRNALFSKLCSTTEGVTLNGPTLDEGELRLPANLNINFGNVDGEALLMNIGRVAVSTGAACTSANPEPSHVLRALGLSDDEVRSSLRFGLGRFTTAAEIDAAAPLIADAVSQLRKLGSSA